MEFSWGSISSFDVLFSLAPNELIEKQKQTSKKIENIKVKRNAQAKTKVESKYKNKNKNKVGL